MYLFCFWCIYVCMYVCHLSPVSIRSVSIYLSSISVYDLCSYISTFLSICQSIFLYPTSFLLFSFLCHFPTPSAFPVNRKSAADIRSLHWVLWGTEVCGDNTMGTLWGLPVIYLSLAQSSTSGGSVLLLAWRGGWSPRQTRADVIHLLVISLLP